MSQCKVWTAFTACPWSSSLWDARNSDLLTVYRVCPCTRLYELLSLSALLGRFVSSSVPLSLPLFSSRAFFFLPQVEVPLSTLRFFYSITQWSCSAPGSLWELPDSNPGLLPQKSGALPNEPPHLLESQHISISAFIYNLGCGGWKGKRCQPKHLFRAWSAGGGAHILRTRTS